jgi:hypothetical protein
MPVDTCFLRRLDAGLAIGEQLHDQPQRADVDPHPLQKRAGQRRKGAPFTRITCLGAHLASPTPQPSAIVGIDRLQIPGLPFPTARTRRPARPANLDQHIPQLPLIHVIDPPAPASQRCQRARRFGALGNRLLLLPLPSPRLHGSYAPLPLLFDKHWIAFSFQEVSQDAGALSTTFSPTHRRTPTLLPRQPSGPPLSVPSRIVVSPNAQWRQQPLVPYIHRPFDRPYGYDNQRQYEYNTPQTWCASHRPPLVRDWPIRTPGRSFCKAPILSRPTLC